MSLRPIQAIALYEASEHGALLPISVGGGKTLISLLLPHVLQASRPLLLAPAKLIAKTKREANALRMHWQIPKHIRLESYELLGRVQAAEMLERYTPDLIVADEAHRLKNPRAAVTRRVTRYLQAHPHCKLVAMSGTITRRSLRDYAHLLVRALGAANAPVPSRLTELEEWADALDERPRVDERIDPGALYELCKTEPRTLDGVRQAFRKRLVETPGVVASHSSGVECSLTISSVHPRKCRGIVSALETLRSAWDLPDGHPLADGLAVWRHARELALGFWYRWEPAPPKAWLAARKEWCSASRHILSTNRRNLDSELQVIHAVDDGHYPVAAQALGAWRAVRDTYKPVTMPVWVSDVVIDLCVAWANHGPGIIWTEHTAFAQRLAEKTGLTFYGPQGRDSRGRAIEDADPKCALIASIPSNSEGRNLQAWNRNLVTSPPASGSAWEQLLGRTHRPGQESDEVTCDVILACEEHMAALEQARADARYIESTTGAQQKLSYADITLGAE